MTVRFLPLAIVGALVVSLAGCKKAQRAASPPALPTTMTSTGQEMVLVPAEYFTMGDNRKDEPDERAHKVYVSAFYIDTRLVTQADYEKVMGANPAKWKGASHPVEQIRWTQAAEYCNARSKLEGLEPAYTPRTWECNFEAGGYRLPTECEWECAVRAGTTTAYCFGDDPSLLREYAWFRDNAVQGTQPVGKKRPMLGGCTMFMATCGNGATTDTRKIITPTVPKRTRRARARERCACCAEVAGHRGPTSAVRPTATMRTPASPTPASGRM